MFISIQAKYYLNNYANRINPDIMCAWLLWDLLKGNGSLEVRIRSQGSRIKYLSSIGTKKGTNIQIFKIHIFFCVNCTLFHVRAFYISLYSISFAHCWKQRLETIMSLCRRDIKGKLSSKQIINVNCLINLPYFINWSCFYEKSITIKVVSDDQTQICKFNNTSIFRFDTRFKSIYIWRSNINISGSSHCQLSNVGFRKYSLTSSVTSTWLKIEERKHYENYMLIYLLFCKVTL